MSKRSDEIRNKYIKNPPEGMAADDIRHISEDDLLDMDYFLNEDDALKNRAYSALFLNISIPHFFRINPLYYTATLNFPQNTLKALHQKELWKPSSYLYGNSTSSV